MAVAMVEAQKQYWGQATVGGPMSLNDLENYRVTPRMALQGQHGAYTLYTAPAPSAGGLGVLQALALLEPFGLSEPGTHSTQLTVEAMRLWLADRARWVGDPSATAVPQAALLSTKHISQGRLQIKPGVRGETLKAPSQLEGDNTTQFTVVDHEGNVVSVTSTIESLWGSGIMVPGYGFLLNNELSDFNQNPQQSDDGLGANDLRPGMRPRSSMAPTLVFEGNQWRMAYGSPGGLTIISTVLEFTQDLLDFKLSPAQALAQKRFAVMDSNGSLLLEEGFPEEQSQALKALGYPVEISPIAIGSVQWVGEDPITHSRSGVADPRRDGSVLIAP
jgi:gamma-glutamyltranspeptidase/glutathione hydrolase